MLRRRSRVAAAALWAVVGVTSGCNVLFGIEGLGTGEDGDGSVGAGGANGSSGQPVTSGAGAGSCAAGYEDPDADGTCTDIDECAAGIHDCHPDADCANEPGTFACACKLGFEGDGKTACTALISCDVLHAKDAALGDGVYPLDVDGAGPSPWFSAYCDMTTDGGGWTLVMKLTSTTTTFSFDAAFWETEATLNDSDVVPNTTLPGGEAKYPAFNWIAGQTLRLSWLDPAGTAFRHTGLGGRTALQLFQGEEEQLAGDESSNACHGNVLESADGWDGNHMRHAKGHQFYGTNGEDSGNGNTGHIRFGFGSNDEPINAWGARHGAGSEGESLVWESATDCNNCTCYGNSYDPDVTAANLWVR